MKLTDEMRRTQDNKLDSPQTHIGQLWINEGRGMEATIVTLFSCLLLVESPKAVKVLSEISVSHSHQ